MEWVGWTSRLAAALMLVACGGEVQAPGDPGSSSVGHLQLTVVDESRDARNIPVDLWYPASDDAGPPTEYWLSFVALESELAIENATPASGQHPLVVFSHGYRGINIQSLRLVETLASHGFVVAAPVHIGNAQDSDGDSFDEAAANRVPDVTAVVDTLLDEYADQIDGERVGVVGHSFGGMTAIGSVAGWAGAAPDPRVGAIVPISAVIDGDLQEDERSGPNAGFRADQLESIDVPVMLMGGTADTNVPMENNAIAFEQMVNAPNIYNVEIVGATHTHFANVCQLGELLIGLGLGQDKWESIGAGELSEPYASTCTGDALPIEVAERLQNVFVVAFFKHHLMGDGEYLRYLTSKYADSEPSARLQTR